MLDKYAGSQSLRDNFGFDNADFETFLLKRGFVLPRTAQANCIYTELSVAALLNHRESTVGTPGRNRLPLVGMTGAAKVRRGRSRTELAVGLFGMHVTGCDSTYGGVARC